MTQPKKLGVTGWLVAIWNCLALFGLALAFSGSGDGSTVAGMILAVPLVIIWFIGFVVLGIIHLMVRKPEQQVMYVPVPPPSSYPPPPQEPPQSP